MKKVVAYGLVFFPNATLLVLHTLLLQRVNDMNTRRPEGDKLFKQSLINVAGTGTVEEIMRAWLKLQNLKALP